MAQGSALKGWKVTRSEEGQGCGCECEGSGERTEGGAFGSRGTGRTHREARVAETRGSKPIYIKNSCKKNPVDNVFAAHDFVWSHLQKHHAQLGQDKAAISVKLRKVSDLVCRAPLKEGFAHAKTLKVVQRDDLGNPVQEIVPFRTSPLCPHRRRPPIQRPLSGNKLPTMSTKSLSSRRATIRALPGPSAYKYGETAMVDIKKRKKYSKEAIRKKLKQLERKRKKEGGSAGEGYEASGRKLFTW
ncbi:hypothetical protein BJ742DRAFT_884346 [Cladochytrium replicatum]|nr:hypothetical protein BJ742DRAFT_884346 [Cladochytrium replicatum]